MAANSLVAGDEVFARFPFGYNDVFRDRGEIFQLIDARNNALLEANRYFLPYNPKEHAEAKCDKCGRRFKSATDRDNHKRKPDCFDNSRQPTKQEFAELVGKDVDKIQLEDGDAGQRTKDLTGAV